MTSTAAPTAFELGAAVTAQQAGVAARVSGTYAGPADLDGFALVAWTTGTGRAVVGRFPAASLLAA